MATQEARSRVPFGCLRTEWALLSYTHAITSPPGGIVLANNARLNVATAYSALIGAPPAGNTDFGVILFNLSSTGIDVSRPGFRVTLTGSGPNCGNQCPEPTVFAVVNAGHHHPVGPGCLGSNALVPSNTATPNDVRGGVSVVYRIGNAPASSVAFLAFGFSSDTWSGGTLPFGLGAIGLSPSCFLRVDPVVLLTVATDGLGVGLQQVLFPAGLAPGLQLFGQAAVLDVGLTTALPLVMSNALATVVGS